MTENNLKSPIPKTLWIAYQVLAALLALTTIWLLIHTIPLILSQQNWESRLDHYGNLIPILAFLSACLAALLRRPWAHHLVIVSGFWFAAKEGYNLMDYFENLVRGLIPVDQVEIWRFILAIVIGSVEFILILTLIALAYKIKNTPEDKPAISRPVIALVLLKKDLILKTSIALLGIALLHGWLSHKQGVYFFEQSFFLVIPVSVILLVPAVLLLLLYHYLQTDAPYAVTSLGISGTLCLVLIPTINWTNYLIWIPPIILGILAVRSRQGSLLLRITALALPLLSALTLNDFHPPFYW